MLSLSCLAFVSLVGSVLAQSGTGPTCSAPNTYCIQDLEALGWTGQPFGAAYCEANPTDAGCACGHGGCDCDQACQNSVFNCTDLAGIVFVQSCAIGCKDGECLC